MGVIGDFRARGRVVTNYDENVQLFKSMPAMSKNSYVQVPIRINDNVQNKNVQSVIAADDSN